MIVGLAFPKKTAKDGKTKPQSPYLPAIMTAGAKKPKLAASSPENNSRQFSALIPMRCGYYAIAGRREPKCRLRSRQ